MSNYEDDHAERRDAKRDGRKRMAVKGRSIFTIQDAENKRVKEIEAKRRVRAERRWGLIRPL